MERVIRKSRTEFQTDGGIQFKVKKCDRNGLNLIRLDTGEECIVHYGTLDENNIPKEFCKSNTCYNCKMQKYRICRNNVNYDKGAGYYIDIAL